MTTDQAARGGEGRGAFSRDNYCDSECCTYVPWGESRHDRVPRADQRGEGRGGAPTDAEWEAAVTALEQARVRGGRSWDDEVIAARAALLALRDRERGAQARAEAAFESDGELFHDLWRYQVAHGFLAFGSLLARAQGAGDSRRWRLRLRELLDDAARRAATGAGAGGRDV